MKALKFIGTIPNEKVEEFEIKAEELFGFEFSSQLNFTETDFWTIVSIDCETEEEARHLDLLTEELND